MVSTRMAGCLTAMQPDDGVAQGRLFELASADVAAILGVTGVGACLALSSTGGGLVLTWGDDPISWRLSDLQFTLGEGPAIDASVDGSSTVDAPDLSGVSDAHWPVFTAEALALGVRAIFAVPLHVGPVGVGALVLHRNHPGALPVIAMQDAAAFASAVTALLVPVLSRTPAEAGELLDRQLSTYQAAGMISVQLHVDFKEALSRLRAFAFGNNRSTSDTADDVVARRLRFDDRQR